MARKGGSTGASFLRFSFLCLGLLAAVLVDARTQTMTLPEEASAFPQLTQSELIARSTTLQPTVVKTIELTGVAASLGMGAGSMNPGVANKAHTGGRLLAGILCQWNHEAKRELADPPWHQFLLPLDVDLGQKSEYSRATGSLVSTTCLFVVSIVGCLIGGSPLLRGHDAWRVFFGNLFSTLLSFFGPNVVALSVTVLRFAEESRHRTVAAACCLCFLFGLVIAVAFVVLLKPNEAQRALRFNKVRWEEKMRNQVEEVRDPSGTETAKRRQRKAQSDRDLADEVELKESSSDTDEGEPERRARELRRRLRRKTKQLTPLQRLLGDEGELDVPLCLLPLFEPADTVQFLFTRLLVVEDLVIAFFIAALSGIKPVAYPCWTISGAQLFFTLAHFVYVAFMRPYRNALEGMFAFGASVIMMALSAACCYATAFAGMSKFSLEAVGWIALGFNFFLYLQLLVLLGKEAVRCFQRRAMEIRLIHRASTNGKPKPRSNIGASFLSNGSGLPEGLLTMDDLERHGVGTDPNIPLSAQLQREELAVLELAASASAHSGREGSGTIVGGLIVDPLVLSYYRQLQAKERLRHRRFDTDGTELDDWGYPLSSSSDEDQDDFTASPPRGKQRVKRGRLSLLIETEQQKLDRRL